MRSVLADITPLRRYRNFRRLWFGLAVSGIGTQLTVVAVAYQAYTMTNSTAVVGLISVVCLLPTLVGSLGGGSVADSMDRRRLLILTQVLLALSSAGLAVNAMLPHPELWVLFVASATTAAFQGIDWPTRLSVLPMIVPAEDLPNAYALQSVVNNVAVVAGPALAGLIIAAFGLGSVYLIDVVSFGATFTAAVLLPPLRPAGGAPARACGPSSTVSSTYLAEAAGRHVPSRSQRHGVRHAEGGVPCARNRAVPRRGGHCRAALRRPGSRVAAGVAAERVGRRSIRPAGPRPRGVHADLGRSNCAFGVIPVLWIGLILLAIAGGADIIGGVFRVAILQKSTPQHMQGRLGGVFYAAAVSGNRLGDGESGLAAAIGGPQFAVWSGGLACIVGTVVLAWRIPALRHKERAARRAQVGGRGRVRAVKPLGDKMAEGRDSEIFEHGPGRVLRMARDGRSLVGEAEVMQSPRDQGYPAPAVYEAGDGYLVMDRLEGPTMLASGIKRPDRLPMFGRMLAALHEQLHAIEAPAGVPDALLAGNQLLHRDLHPLNVLITAAGPVVIDWSNRARGDPAYDVADTWVLFATAEVPGGGWTGARRGRAPDLPPVVSRPRRPGLGPGRDPRGCGRAPHRPQHDGGREGPDDAAGDLGSGDLIVGSPGEWAPRGPLCAIPVSMRSGSEHKADEGERGGPGSAQAERGGPLARLRPVTHAQLGQHRRHVMVDGPGGDHEALGDLGVAQAVGHQLQDLELTVAEAGRVAPRRRASAALDARAPMARSRPVARNAAGVAPRAWNRPSARRMSDSSSLSTRAWASS